MIFRIFLVLAISGSALGASDCQDLGDRGKGYNGTEAKTENGATCQAWSSQEPHTHKLSETGDNNFCRNPDGEDRVWCYTTDPNSRWEYCDVALCTDATSAVVAALVVKAVAAVAAVEDAAAVAAVKEREKDEKTEEEEKAAAAAEKVCGNNLCPKLKLQHELVAMARLAYHCPNHPSKGEQTECDTQLLDGMQDCTTKFDNCILKLILTTDACNSTGEICESLHRLQNSAANSRLTLCKSQEAEARIKKKEPARSTKCGFWNELVATPAILAAKASCRWLDTKGKTAFEDCVVGIVGADNKYCICEDLRNRGLFPELCGSNDDGK